ncbi:MAG: DHHW family protein [Solirubrobacterales bacterium]
MKAKAVKLNSGLFIGMIILLTLMNLMNPQQIKVSRVENRILQPKPAFSLEALFSGRYFMDYQNYFADAFIGREQLVRISTAVKQLTGPGKMNGVTLVSTGGGVVQNQAGEAKNAQTGGRVENNILILGDRALDVHHFSEPAAAAYAANLNDFSQLAGSGVRVFSLIAPTQIEFHEAGGYQDLSSSQLKTIQFINRKLNPEIIPVDAYSALKAHRNEYVYFRTDHHWTALGAYYAYSAFIEQAGEKPVPLRRYKRGKAEGFLGSLYKQTLNAQLKSHPDTLIYYKPFTKYRFDVYYKEGRVQGRVIHAGFIGTDRKYGIFLGGDQPWARIRTNNPNGRRILVVKDSYANAFIPFLLPHYQEIYMVDSRSFKGKLTDMVKTNRIQDVLFLNYVLVTENPGWINQIRQSF